MVLKDCAFQMKTRPSIFILILVLMGCSPDLHLKKSISPSLAPDYLNQIKANIIGTVYNKVRERELGGYYYRYG